MDKQKIMDCCDRIILAANNISVMGERNMTNLQGVCQLTRIIRAEAERDEPEQVEAVNPEKGKPVVTYADMKKAEAK